MDPAFDRLLRPAHDRRPPPVTSPLRLRVRNINLLPGAVRDAGVPYTEGSASENLDFGVCPERFSGKSSGRMRTELGLRGPIPFPLVLSISVGCRLDPQSYMYFNLDLNHTSYPSTTLQQ
ncbi:hypothetical protein EVAR_13034_1 [Eumeta japonica]|uniref:Uncharacterized protein n=1 Tax=Eumeta variegata TaxID=151549 RepID=A0A4C1VJV7_EUMVA|nr:hypothetical protein EVAR_13034_1 [Eumeta japonica]